MEHGLAKAGAFLVKKEVLLESSKFQDFLVEIIGLLQYPQTVSNLPVDLVTEGGKYQDAEDATGKGHDDLAADLECSALHGVIGAALPFRPPLSENSIASFRATMNRKLVFLAMPKSRVGGSLSIRWSDGAPIDAEQASLLRGQVSTFNFLLILSRTSSIFALSSSSRDILMPNLRLA